MGWVFLHNADRELENVLLEKNQGGLLFTPTRCNSLRLQKNKVYNNNNDKNNNKVELTPCVYFSVNVLSIIKL